MSDHHRWFHLETGYFEVDKHDDGVDDDDNDD